MTGSLQDLGHPEGHDYDVGSAHLTHRRLRNWIVSTLRDLVAEQFRRKGQVRALEIGAGHGAFTDHLLAMGAQVTVTEMSGASADLLSERYRNNPAARVVFDSDGAATQNLPGQFDLVCAVSVLHHIPDYLGAVGSWLPLIGAGGTFVSFADPLWYPRRSRTSMAADRGAYLTWRLGRGDRIAGARGLVRRARGHYQEDNPRDMVEYHVLRQGCDEQALAGLLRSAFAEVEVLPYWSTPSMLLQAVGDRLPVNSDFGLVGRGRFGDGT